MSFTEDELQAFNSILEERLTAHRQEVEATVDRMLAAQLLGIEQLLAQHEARRKAEAISLPPLEEIEVQTELPWQDLATVIGKAMEDHLASLSDSLQRSVKDLEQCLIDIRHELTRNQGHLHISNERIAAPEIYAGLEHLEQVMESMQVAMTANHALLSNRLYHHQHLPLERAHPSNHSQATRITRSSPLLARTKEHDTNGSDFGEPDTPGEEETTGQEP